MWFLCFNYHSVMSIVLALFAVFLIDNITGDINTNVELLRQVKLPPCRACKIYVDSFKKAIDRTERNKFDGGDAAWEESKLSSYANSEVRLAEIQELVCTDIEEGRYQCYTNNEQWESFVEEWWWSQSSISMNDEIGGAHDDRTGRTQLQDALCIDEAKVCCPKGGYGPNCQLCSNCGEHGRCAGSGTRKGNGQCHCDSGYAGTTCTICASGYYESFRANNGGDRTATDIPPPQQQQQSGMFLCSRCHPSCAGNCTGPGPRKCDACADGWRPTKTSHTHTSDGDTDSSMVECIDIDECAEVSSVKRRCKRNEWCVNKEGSYECLACDGACAGCTGDGPDLCIRCGDGYELITDVCVESHGESRRRWIVITRYLTYIGLCLTTCIVLQRSVWAAALIGVAVALYISVSEYVILNPSSHASPNATDLTEKFLFSSNPDPDTHPEPPKPHI